MWRIRCFEERVAKLYRSLQVHGLIHLSIGSERVAATMCGTPRADDTVYSGSPAWAGAHPRRGDPERLGLGQVHVLLTGVLAGRSWRTRPKPQ